MPGTTQNVRPITVPEGKPSHRPMSRTSFGSRSGTPVMGHTTNVKLRRSSAKTDDPGQTEEEGLAENVLLTEVPNDDESVPLQTEEQAVHWTTHDEGNDHYGNTSNNGDDDDYFVDITVDNGYDTDLEVDDEEFIQGPEEYDPSGLKDYIKECNRLGVIPCSYFERHVEDTHFCMRNHGLGPLGAKAIAKPLEFNTAIERIDLEGNCIEADGAKYLAGMLKENSYITELIIPENHLGSLGAQAICNTLLENGTVKWIDLSGNNFLDTDGDFFFKLLEGNSTIRRLHLAHNNFGVEAARAFKDALSVNESLRVLDLSWNHFRLKGAALLAEGIKENYGLKELNLKMNGFANDGAKAMGIALKQNQCLEILDLSSNRITSDGALDIARALQTNSDLKALRIGENPVAYTGALALLAAISKNENTEMNELYLDGVVVNDNFEELHDKMRMVRPMWIIHGGVMSKKVKLTGGKSKWKSDDDRYFDLMTRLKRYIADENFRMVDIFKQFDKDNSWAVDAKEFQTGVLKSGIDMSPSDMAFLAKRLDKDGDGNIDYGELVFADNKTREIQRKIEKEKAAKGTTEDEDDDAASVASVDAILNALDKDLPDEVDT